MIDYLHGRRYALVEMARLERARLRAYVTPLVLYEAYRGVWSRGIEGTEIERLGAKVSPLPFERHAAREAARIGVTLRRGGEEIPVHDLYIAASTIVWGDCEIITKDVGHFGRLRGFGLKIRPLAQ